MNGCSSDIVGAAALLGGSAANAADNTVKAKAATDATQSTDISSRQRHYRLTGCTVTVIIATRARIIKAMAMLPARIIPVTPRAGIMAAGRTTVAATAAVRSSASASVAAALAAADGVTTVVGNSIQ